MPWRKGNRLKRVREDEAIGRVKEVYEDTQRALGLPYVDFVFQAFAPYPEFLDRQWAAFKPAVESGTFFELGERLRADAYTRAHSYFKIPDITERTSLLSLGRQEQAEINNVVEISLYGKPLLLLLMAAQLQAFEIELGQQSCRSVPAHHPVFSGAPVLIEEESAPPDIRHIFEEVKRSMAMPFVPGEYRALARWPGFLQVYWNVIKEFLASPVYEGCHHALRESAFALARELPERICLTIPDLMEASISDNDVTSVVRITELFVNSLSMSVLNIAIAKIGMEGGSGVRERRTAETREKTEEAA